MRIGLLIILFALASGAYSQTGHQLDFKIKGLKDTTVYLAYYNWDKTYIRDTARSTNGAFTFKGKDLLRPGMYMIVMGNTPVFDMVMGTDQHFSIATSKEDYINNMKVTGDEDNRLFFEDMLFNMERNKEASPYIKSLQDSTASEGEKLAAREVLNKINEKVQAHQNNLIEKYPTTITAKWLKATRPIHVPDPPKKEDGTIDSAFQYKYYRAHYFDNFDLGDEALIQLRKPLYQEKITEYLDRLIVPQPDSIMNAIDALAVTAKKSQETYKYFIWNCITHFQASKIMGLDEVYVRLFDKYFASGEMDFWISDVVKKNMRDYADKVRLSLIGNTAPNLIMQDLTLQPKSMYDIKKKYTLIYIFDPDCGHCREETPKLVTFYDEFKTKYNFEVYAVSADTSMKKMKNYIEEMKMKWITVNGPRSYVGNYQKLYDAFTTPSLFVLDEKKKIIAKKLSIEQLKGFMENYEKMQKRKNEEGKGT